MFLIKQHLYDLQEQEPEDLWESYLEYIEDNKDLFQQLPLKEVWKPIPNFPGYEVSSFGRVMSYRRKTPVIMKQTLNQENYCQVLLIQNNKPKLCRVHRLVAITFIPNPKNYPIVLHKDNNRTNNYIKNLKWGTQSDNISQCVREGRNRHNTKPNLVIKKKVSWVLKSPTGELVVVNNLKKFIRQQGMSVRLYQLTKNNIPEYKGWTTTFCPVK